MICVTISEMRVAFSVVVFLFLQIKFPYKEQVKEGGATPKQRDGEGAIKHKGEQREETEEMEAAGRAETERFQSAGRREMTHISLPLSETSTQPGFFFFFHS